MLGIRHHWRQAVEQPLKPWFVSLVHWGPHRLPELAPRSLFPPWSCWQGVSVQSCLPYSTAWPGLLPRVFSLLPNIFSALAVLKEIGNALKLCCSPPVAHCIFWPFISRFSVCHGRTLGSFSWNAWKMCFVHPCQLRVSCTGAVFAEN